jgi:hypothetical protein
MWAKQFNLYKSEKQCWAREPEQKNQKLMSQQAEIQKMTVLIGQLKQSQLQAQLSKQSLALQTDLA